MSRQHKILLEVTDDEEELIAAIRNQKPVNNTDIKQCMSDIMLSVSWREIARTYFNNSAAWFYNKIDGNAITGGFSEQETRQLKDALCDLAERIKKCADKI
ncbi:MAG: DUF5053 domain-containing protein [Bacteroidales bacterium]|nr:DUF5053 domain-containing protein [Bacteroidales bacterium]